GSSQNLDLVNLCIDRNKRLADLSTTNESILYGKRMVSVLPNQYLYQLYLTQGNRFNRQRMGFWSDVNDWNLIKEAPAIDQSDRPVVLVTSNIGDLIVTTPVGDNGGTVEIRPKVDLTNYINNLNSDLTTAKNNLTNAETANKNALAKLNDPPNPGLLAQLKTAKDD